MGDETTAGQESLETRLNEPRYAGSLRPPGSLSPRYGVTKAERNERRGRPPEPEIPPSEKVNARLKLERRRKIVAENFISGLSPSQIAEAVAGVKGFETTTPATVQDDLKVILQRWKREQVEAVQPHVLKIVARCERMINAVWTKAVNGDKDAQEQVRKNQQQIMRVLRIGQAAEPAPQTQGMIPVGQGGQTVNIQQINLLMQKPAYELHDDQLAIVAQLDPKLIEGVSHGVGHSARPVDPQIERETVGPGEDESRYAVLDADPGGPAADIFALDGGSAAVGAESFGAGMGAGTDDADGDGEPDPGDDGPG